MPTVSVNGARYYFESHGQDGETVVLSHGFLFDRRMFDAQARDLSAHFRCVAFDWRGQGRSETTRSGYDVDSLADDAAAFMAAVDIAPCHFIGLSMGGFVGLRLAIQRPELLRSLVLINTSADAEPQSTVPKYLLLGLIARAFGLRPVVSQVMSILFGPTFMHDPEREDERRFWRAQISAVNRIGAYCTLLGVVFRRGVASQLHRIATPTLIIAGEEDVPFPPRKARGTAVGITNAQFVCIPHAGHSSTIEQAEAVTQAIAGFLGRIGAPSSDRAFGS